MARLVQVASCYEAGYDAFWLHRMLVANDVDNHVIGRASLLVDRRGRRAKSDRIDAEGMLHALMANARGEPRARRQNRCGRFGGLHSVTKFNNI